MSHLEFASLLLDERLSPYNKKESNTFIRASSNQVGSNVTLTINQADDIWASGINVDEDFVSKSNVSKIFTLENSSLNYQV